MAQKNITLYLHSANCTTIKVIQCTRNNVKSLLRLIDMFL